ncbi:hypothetical protein L7F22_012513 [Adiantum nelumboides]|nr:hypothetical protein [Adiantum nelumboides]
MAPSQNDPKVELYPLGDFALQSGEVLADAHLAYRTYGDPSLPAIVYPTWYSGTITAGNEWLIDTEDHPRKALKPSQFFIVVPALFGNGESTSPSNAGPDMPKTTFYDNVRAQHLLLTEKFKKKTVIVLGWSMGAAQAFQWASQYPDMVRLAVPFCGSARTSPHNWVFLEAVKGAVTTDTVGYADGRYMDVHGCQPLAGLRALGRVYAGWGFSQTFYRNGGFKKHFGIDGLEDVMVHFWEAWSTSKDANNMLHMLWTWQPLYAGDSKRDVPVTEGGRLGVRGKGMSGLDERDEAAFKRALSGIKCPVLVMPCSQDLYFPPEDSLLEVKAIERAAFCPIESEWGHWAGGPGDSVDDAQFIDEKIFVSVTSAYQDRSF